MKPHDAQTASSEKFRRLPASQNSCCEIRRSLPVDSMSLKWGCTLQSQFCQASPRCGRSTFPHHNLTGLMRQLIAITVLAYLFVVVRRAQSQRAPTANT
jgi:hypothetical protein